MDIYTESSDPIRFSKYNAGWPAAAVLVEWLRSAARFRGLFLGFLAGAFGFSILISYSTGLYMIISIPLAFAALLVTSSAIALFISNRFLVLLTDGFKDSFFICSAFGGYISMPLLALLAGPDQGITFATFLTVALFILLSLFYAFRIAPKKIPNLTLVVPSEADKITDIKYEPNDIVYRKIRVDGDTRNAFILSKGSTLRFYIKQGVKNVKTAVASEDVSGRSSRVDVYELLNGSNRRLLTSKYLDPSSSYETRGWNDLDLDIMNGHDGTCIEMEYAADIPGRGPQIYVAQPRPMAAGREPRKVIIVVADAVRSDHLGAYGYKRPVSPNIDEFAGDSLKLENAMVQGEWTLPSFMSMITSTYPSVHGVYHHEAHSTLSKNITTLPEVLRNNGFITKGIFTHMRLVPYFGFARGLDSHFFRQCDKENHVGDVDDVTMKAIDLLEFHKKDDLFLMMHYFDTHQPCVPSGVYNSLFKNTYRKDRIHEVRNKLLGDPGFVFAEDDIKDFIDSYDTEIYKIDMRFGMLTDYLKRSGQYENACIIFLSDHGMLLNDHGSMSAITLFDESMKVPFMVKFPHSSNVEKGSLDNFISEACIDIMPTILDLCGIKIPQTCQGSSIARYVKEEKKLQGKERAVSEYFFKDWYGVSVRDRSFRYTFNTKFNIKDFCNYKDDTVREELYSVNDNLPETIYKGDDREALMEKYKGIINAHIKDSVNKTKEFKK